MAKGEGRLPRRQVDGMKVTLSRIAEETGLSPAVLSRVVSGNGYVSPAMREKAQQALEQYGYSRAKPRVNEESRMDNVILIITGATANTYHDVIREFTISARKISKKVLTAHSNYESEVEEKYLRFAQQMGFYGVVMLSVVETRSMARLIRDSGIPVVMMGRYTARTMTDIVTQDSYEMGTMAANYLTRAGHTRLGYLGGHAQSSITQDKQSGYGDQLEYLGVPLSGRWIGYGALDYKSGVAYGRELLAMEEAPTGIFVSNDQMAMGLIDELTRAGCRIPEDLSVICCDRTMTSDIYHLPLNRLYIDWGEATKPAFQLLRLRHDDPARPRQLITFDTQYIPGRTIAAPRQRPGLMKRDETSAPKASRERG